MIFFLCGHFFNLCINSVIISRRLHTNFEGMELIRPLYLVREDDIKAWRDYNGLHFIQCACKFTDMEGLGLTI